MLGRLFGRLVLVVVVVVGLYFIISHYHGGTDRFGCQSSAGAAMAHADSNGCPANIGAAADDAQWAADRLATIANAKQTTGLFYEADGTETKVISGREDISTRIDAFLRSSGTVRMPPAGQHPAATHVEAKVAMTMREQDVSRGVLVINNPTGPCPGAYSCTQVLDVLLPSGATLVVWWPGGQHRTFTGGS